MAQRLARKLALWRCAHDVFLRYEGYLVAWPISRVNQHVVKGLISPCGEIINAHGLHPLLRLHA